MVGKAGKSGISVGGGDDARDITRADRSVFTGPVERRLELSTKVELTRWAPSVCSLLSYCIVSGARRAVLEQVSSTLFSPDRLFHSSVLIFCTDSPSCFVIGISFSLSSSFSFSLSLSSTVSRIARPRLFFFALLL